MRIWITGVAGFLGSHLAQALLADGHHVAGNDNLVCGDITNIPHDNLGFTLFEDENDDKYCLDCREFEAMYDGMMNFKPDVVVHCAATASEGFSVFSPAFITQNTYEASVSTFSAAIASGVKRIVYMSSMARYGKGNPPFTEDMETKPVDPYGIAKEAAEKTLKVLCDTHNVKYSILVPHNIIGTRQQITPYRNVVSIFLNRLKLGLPVYVYGDGEQKRCFSPVRDCIQSIKNTIYGDADSEVVNIGPDNGEITINHLLDICEEVTGIKAERIYLPSRPVTDDVKEAYCSSDKARKLLGYEPQQSLFDCIREMSANMIAQPFDYNFPIEIQSDIMPRTWSERL